MNKTTSIRRRALNGGLAAALALGAVASGSAASASTVTSGDASDTVVRSGGSGAVVQALNPACLSFQYTFNSRPTDPRPGDVVTYRMEFVNNGSVDSTKSEIAFGLGGVLDDSSWDTASLGATVGGVTVSGDTVTWRGPLASGERVVIAFTGIWHGDGDGLAFPRVESYGYTR